MGSGNSEELGKSCQSQLEDQTRQLRASATRPSRMPGTSTLPGPVPASDA
jgi:hypothetical protein